MTDLPDWGSGVEVTDDPPATLRIGFIPIDIDTIKRRIIYTMVSLISLILTEVTEVMRLRLPMGVAVET